MGITKEVLDKLQELIGEGNASRGFHDEGDRLRGEALDGNKYADANLRHYHMAKIGLVVTEASEALEEIRKGRSANETYYSAEVDGKTVLFPEQVTLKGGALAKPEGTPSEMADTVIRCFDFAHEEGFSLADIILEKLDYNATRGNMHGGKKL